MTTASLTLQGVSFSLPDGRPLFPALDVRFDRRPTGLFGRNGVGKSVLARILAGRLKPTAGRCLRHGRVHYVPQQVLPAPDATIAEVAGIAPVLAALARIEAGGVDPADFAAVGDRWDVRERLAAALDAHDLGHLQAGQPAAAASGGELTRVALIGAWLAEADMLILDEPSNHLDRVQRGALRDALQAWSGGLIVVSHDRELLESMQRIVELSPAGLRDYGGGYAFYAQARGEERTQAREALARSRHARRRGEAEVRAQREALARRQARGAREGRTANQAPILLGRRRQQSEASAGQALRRQAERVDTLREAVAVAASRVDDDAPLALFAPLPASAAQRRVAVLDGVVAPYGAAGRHRLDLAVSGRQRIAVTGPNGSGKSTLLKLVAGLAEPREGRCTVHVPAAYLGQRLDGLDPEATPLMHLQRGHPAAAQTQARTWLALLGLDAAAVDVPSRLLSGGERLKTALAGALYRSEPAELLLLDEPTNHLDLAALEALERMLAQYPGALMVVSHDETFLDRLALDTRIEPRADGWRVTPW
ncbi:MAG TPA: ABC-F family ATP-binding cassette domain-containing protein [Dokdonella sp.]|uniref:ABC-F family ATP-binding cassette domain-containing protein n=1 Tax=Dokdonella sp. TaxID=2291710 RepID=UPI002C9EF623|nr:ABC-F family ATP-binding cassette domain-containing protein [Dokdonella sp.]HUD40879.1 ABC-F family ATP-binding cassette domain-containing protein [Dokdonella sp.]